MLRPHTNLLNSPAIETESAECLYYRDRFRAARYAALADAEGFGEICFALEALGLRLLGRRGALDGYKPGIATCAQQSVILTEMPAAFPTRFKSFEALYSTVQNARNDAMHLGAYARHATDAAIDLCIGLEEALVSGIERTVSNLMVASPITVEPWQPVAHARQVMLMHSFSFLPVRIEESWWLMSELGLAKFLNVPSKLKATLLGQTIEEAKADGLEMRKLLDGDLLRVNMTIAEVLKRSDVQAGPMLWLVVDEEHPDHLAGVLSPFEIL